MPGETTSEQSGVNVPRDMAFETLAGQRLEARIESLAIAPSPHGPVIVSRFTMSFSTFQRALEGECFHLFAESLPGADLAAFHPERPVQLQARLRRVFAREFIDDGLDALATEMADCLSEEAQRLLCTESWVALSVTQKLPLPPDLPDTASTELGFETAWNALAGGRSPDSLSAIAAAGLRALGYHVERVKEGLMRTAVQSGGSTWPLIVHVEEEQRTCVCWSVYPTLVPPDRRAQVAQFLVERNYDEWIGGFEMDPADGEIRFRTSVELGGAPLDARLFERLVTCNIAGMARVYPLLAVYFGE